MSAEDYADELFNNPGEESEAIQASARGDAEPTLSSSDEDDSMPDVLAAFPQPHVLYQSAGWWKLVSLDRHKPFVSPVRRGDVVLLKFAPRGK